MENHQLQASSSSAKQFYYSKPDAQTTQAAEEKRTLVEEGGTITVPGGQRFAIGTIPSSTTHTDRRSGQEGQSQEGHYCGLKYCNVGARRQQRSMSEGAQIVDGQTVQNRDHHNNMWFYMAMAAVMTVLVVLLPCGLLALIYISRWRAAQQNRSAELASRNQYMARLTLRTGLLCLFLISSLISAVVVFYLIYIHTYYRYEEEAVTPLPVPNREPDIQPPLNTSQNEANTLQQQHFQKIFKKKVKESPT